MQISKRLAVLPLVCGLSVAGTAHAQLGGGNWTEYSPTFSVQQRGCGVANNLTFTLTCSDTTNDNRAERRYATYGGGPARQFEGFFKITSLTGTRISLKQTFKDDPGAGPDFMMAVENGGRLYAVHGGDTIAPAGTATVGTTVRVNTIHRVGTDHRCYINGSLKFTVSSDSGNYYDKFGFYRTSSGKGPGSVTWSGIRFWTSGGSGTPTPSPTATSTPTATATPTRTATPTATTVPPNDVEVTPPASAVTASTNDGNVPGNVVDNNLGTRWSAIGDPQWVKLDLGSVRTVTRVGIAVYNGNSRQNRFDLQVSTDNTNWTNVLTGALSSGTTTQEQILDVPHSSARWVRYFGHGCTDPTKATTNSVTEISVFALTATATPTATPTPTPTVVPPATPTATASPSPTTPPSYVEVTPAGSAVTASTNDGNVPANTVDNNLSTRWSANGDGQWLQLDLGSTRTVGSVNVAVYNGNSRRNMFDLQVATTAGGPWTTVFSGQSSGTTNAEEPYPFTNVAARYVRYLGHMNTVNGFNSVTEVSVFALP
jgi:hypothetical protein